MKTAIIILVSALALFIFLFILSEISLREEINKWAKEVAENGKLKEMNAELEKKLDFYKSCEQTLKVELQLDADFPEDIKREFVYKRLCKELDRVFKENPDICLIKTENNLFDRGVDVKARIRFLPYIHGAEY